MQTFLPSTSFEQSAKWLDNLRLSKQRVEVLQILKALTDPEYGWQNHPAVKMWRGYEWELCAYGVTICNEWVNRGYKDSCEKKIMKVGYLVHSHFREKALDDAIFDMVSGKYDVWELFVQPTWLTEEFASNHRSVLLGKAQETYAIKFDNFYYTTNAMPFLPWDGKEYRKASRELVKAQQVLDWYTSFNWKEQPAQRNSEGKWPYVWPVF